MCSALNSEDCQEKKLAAVQGDSCLSFVDSQSSYTQPAAVYGQSQPPRQVMSIKPVQTVNATSSSYSSYPTGTTGQQNASSTAIQSYTPSSSTYASSSYNSSPASYSGKNLMETGLFS